MGVKMQDQQPYTCSYYTSGPNAGQATQNLNQVPNYQSPNQIPAIFPDRQTASLLTDGTVPNGRTEFTALSSTQTIQCSCGGASAGYSSGLATSTSTTNNPVSYSPSFGTIYAASAQSLTPVSTSLSQGVVDATISPFLEVSLWKSMTFGFSPAFTFVNTITNGGNTYSQRRTLRVDEYSGEAARQLQNKQCPFGQVFSAHTAKGTYSSYLKQAVSTFNLVKTATGLDLSRNDYNSLDAKFDMVLLTPQQIVSPTQFNTLAYVNPSTGAQSSCVKLASSLPVPMRIALTNFPNVAAFYSYSSGGALLTAAAQVAIEKSIKEATYVAGTVCTMTIFGITTSCKPGDFGCTCQIAQITTWTLCRGGLHAWHNWLHGAEPVPLLHHQHQWRHFPVQD